MYKVKLQNFEGPLDLLLFFVRKDELDIYDIPIAHITKSYLDYLHLMRELNLDIAAEFILMAATLMRIKVKSMLPKDPTEDEEEEELDPREELTRRLIEYRQFKEASKSLAELDEYWRTVYRRSYFNFDLIPQHNDEPVGLKDVTFFDLLAAYKKALAKKPKIIYHNIERLNVTIEQQQEYIFNFFGDHKCYLFTDLCAAMGKIEIVVTFLAMLDLIKRGDIAVKQATIFDDIWIYKPDAYVEDEMEAAENAEERRIESIGEGIVEARIQDSTNAETGMLNGSDKMTAETINDLDESIKVPDALSADEPRSDDESVKTTPSEILVSLRVDSDLRDDTVDEDRQDAGGVFSPNEVESSRDLSPVDARIEGDREAFSELTEIPGNEMSSDEKKSETDNEQPAFVPVDASPDSSKRVHTTEQVSRDQIAEKETNEAADVGSDVEEHRIDKRVLLGDQDAPASPVEPFTVAPDVARKDIPESPSALRRIFSRIVTFVKRIFLNG